jgi:hypothetical protein
MIKLFDYFPKNKYVTGPLEQGSEEQENKCFCGKNT